MRTISKIVNDGVVSSEIDGIFVKIKEALKAPFTPNFSRVWAVAPEISSGFSIKNSR